MTFPEIQKVAAALNQRGVKALIARDIIGYHQRRNDAATDGATKTLKSRI